MVKWSGGEETRLGHFTPKVRIFQEVLLNGIRWIVKRPSTKKADSLKPILRLLGGDGLASGNKSSRQGRNRAQRGRAIPESSRRGKQTTILII